MVDLKQKENTLVNLHLRKLVITVSNSINREQLIDILNYIGSPKIVNKEGKDDVQFCCTIHG